MNDNELPNVADNREIVFDTKKLTPCFVCEASTNPDIRPGRFRDDKGRAWCLDCAKRALSMLVFKKEHKQDRNERCACGSGKKYKHCCIDK